MTKPYGIVVWLLAGLFLMVQLVGADQPDKRLKRIRDAKTVEELAEVRDTLRSDDQHPLADREVRRAWRDRRRELAHEAREVRRRAHEAPAPGTR